MHKFNDCLSCEKYSICKIVDEYKNKSVELTDFNNDYYVTYLHCKNYENKQK